MGKSTGRVQSRGRGRSDVMMVFSPRTAGPWHLLAPLHSRGGFLFLLVLTVVGVAWAFLHAMPVLGWLIVAVAVGLFVFSFSLLWLLIGLLVRSRAELTVIAVVVGAWIGLHLLLPSLWANITLALLVAGVLLFPPTGRAVWARMWCVMDRHRLRASLRQAKVRTMNMDGALPFLLWARPTKTGERVWLWIRAGSSGGDIENALEYIAPACYARDARLTGIRSMATVVAIDVIRRDPLSTGATVTSPLAKLTSFVTGTINEEGTEPISGATVYDITSMSRHDTVRAPAAHTTMHTTVHPSGHGELPDYPATPQRKTRKPTTTTPVEPVQPGLSVLTGGQDLSDYID